MAETINARDLALASTGARLLDVDLAPNITVASARGIEIAAPSQIFRIASSGTAEPTSIVLTAVLAQLSGEVVWTIVVGTATLSTTGVGANQRLLTPANMTSNFVTIRASLLFNGVTYTADFSIAKIDSGINGTRGSIVLVGTGSAWSDATANGLILSFTGSSTKVVGDRVTIHNGSTFANTRYWTGAVWAPLESVIDGNMLVTGSIFANHLTVNSITTTNLQSNTATIPVSAYTAGDISVPSETEVTVQTCPQFTSKGGVVVINFGCVVADANENLTYRIRRNGTELFSLVVVGTGLRVLPPIADTPGSVAVTYTGTVASPVDGLAVTVRNRGMYALEAIR